MLAISATILSPRSPEGSVGNSSYLLNNYVVYLEGTFLIHRPPLFGWSPKLRSANPEKIHAIDPGLAAAARGFA